MKVVWQPHSREAKEVCHLSESKLQAAHRVCVGDATTGGFDPIKADTGRSEAKKAEIAEAKLRADPQAVQSIAHAAEVEFFSMNVKLHKKDGLK